MTKDKLLSNTRNLNGDIIFQVNKAGVTTEALRVVGSSGALKLASGFLNSVRTVTATGSLLATDSVVVAAPASAAITLTLPPAVAGQTLYIKRNSSNYMVYVAPASGTIDGTTSLTLGANYSSVVLASDGTNWFVF